MAEKTRKKGSTSKKQPSTGKKRKFRPLRLIFGALLLSPLVYSVAVKKELAISLVLNSTQLNLELSDGIETSSKTVNEIELLRNKIFTPSIVAAGLDTFKLAVKPIHLNEYYLVDLIPISSDRSQLKVSSLANNVALVSLIYDGAIRLDISASDSSTSFQFKTYFDSTKINKVYAEISLPNAFDLEYDDINFRLSSTLSEENLGDKWNIKRFTRPRNYPMVTLTNIEHYFYLKMANKFILNKNLFREIQLDDFDVNKLNLMTQKSENAPVNGHYRYLNTSDTTKHPIPKDCNIRYSAKELTLKKLEISDGTIDWNITGIFSSLEFQNVGKYEEKLPPILFWYAGKTPFAPLTILGGCIYYLLIVIRITFGIKVIKEIGDLIRVWRGK